MENTYSTIFSIRYRNLTTTYKRNEARDWHSFIVFEIQEIDVLSHMKNWVHRCKLVESIVETTLCSST